LRRGRLTLPRVRAHWWAYVAVLALLAASLAFRLAVLPDGHIRASTYDADALNRFAAYSDIPSLFFRDRLWRHPAPYYDYRFEYPVLLGAVVWVLSKVHRTATDYFLVTSGLLAACALVSVGLLGRLRGARPALFAFAPALAFTGLLNWDLIAIALTLAALYLHSERRDVAGALALSAAVWTKFFPIVCLPIVLACRVAERRFAAAARILAVFGAVTLAVNLPVALASTAARHRWSYFFSYNAKRKPTVSAWLYVDLSPTAINVISGALLALIVGAAVVAVWRRRDRATDALVLGACVALVGFFAVGKVFNPQYALWIMAALAAVGARWRLALAFVAADTAVFLTHLAGIHPHSSLIDVSNVARQAVTVGLVLVLLWQLWRARPAEAAMLP
jgi:uncharacterized membrane protein